MYCRSQILERIPQPSNLASSIGNWVQTQNYYQQENLVCARNEQCVATKRTNFTLQSLEKRRKKCVFQRISSGSNGDGGCDAQLNDHVQKLRKGEER